jgi:hypothetical protein
MAYRPSEVLAMLFKLKNWESFTGDPIMLHNVFYELYEKNQDVMNDFNFIKRSNPLCTTLEQLITLFQLVGILSRSNPDFLEYRINRSRLSEFLRKEMEEFPRFEGLEALDRLQNCPLS